MRMNESYRYIGTCDTAAVRARVLAQTEADWNANALRQRTFPAHQDTQTLPLLFDADYRHEKPTRQAKFAEFEQELRPLMTQVHAHFQNEGEFVRLMLARLRPGGRVLPHGDFGYSLNHSHRVHIPLVTNPGVEFIVNGQSKFLPEGEIWEINNIDQHEVYNRSDAYRVHLILDLAVPFRGGQRLQYMASQLANRTRLATMRLLNKQPRKMD